jgi:UDPglucose 6-dehydrogenase
MQRFDAKLTPVGQQNHLVIGAGYVGLVTAVCLAAAGFDVTVLDHDAAKIAALRAGHLALYEPDLPEMILQQQAEGRLRFIASADAWAEHVTAAELIFIAVGTPARRGDGQADLADIEAAMRQIAPCLKSSRRTSLVIRSTVPVGTTRRLGREIRACNPAANFVLISNPEFLREGSAVADFIRPHRIVIGADEVEATAGLRRIYGRLCPTATPILVTTPETAELSKYASNAFLATKLAFANEIADFCEAGDADYDSVAAIMGMDPRIGAEYLRAGPGFGGSCLPKDLRALAETGHDYGVAMPLLRAVSDSNAERPAAMVRRIVAACGGTVAGKTLALLGMSFKAGTNDLRDSPALAVARQLQTAGAVLQIYDPAVQQDELRVQLPDIIWAENALAAAEDAAALVVLTEWPEFQTLDFAALAGIMAKALVIDLRGCLDEAKLMAAGLRAVRVGRALSQPESLKPAKLFAMRD